MKEARALFIAAATLALLAGLSSCASYRVVVPTDSRLIDSSTHSRVTSVVGYTTTDGRYHRFVAHATVRSDSVILTRPTARSVTSVGVGGSPESVIVLPRDKVRSLKVHEGVSVFRSVLVVVAGIMVFAVVALIADPIEPSL
jgi:hypothetical protein